MNAFDVTVAAVLALLGVRSLVYWLRRPFHPASTGERMLYVLNLTCRIGFWFALAGFFLAWAVVEEPQSVGWFILLPIALAGLQLLTGFLLANREPGGSAEGGGEDESVSRSNGHGAAHRGGE